jgi:hypothetical protein
MLIVAPEATPFAFVLATTELGVSVEPPEVVEVGISQPTKISAEAEKEIPIPIAQNAEINLMKVLVFILPMRTPIYSPTFTTTSFITYRHIGKFNTEILFFNSRVTPYQQK